MPPVIPAAWANLTEMLWAVPSVQRSGIYALLSGCRNLRSLTISVGRDGYILDLPPDPSKSTSHSLRSLRATIVHPQDAPEFLRDIGHESIQFIQLHGGAEANLPLWPTLSQDHTFSHASFLRYFNPHAGARVQIEMYPSKSKSEGAEVFVRRQWPVDFSFIRRQLQDASFTRSLISLEIAHVLWLGFDLPPAPLLERLTAVIGADGPNVVSEPVPSHAGVTCPRLHRLTLSVPTRMLEYDPYAFQIGSLPVSLAFVIAFLTKLRAPEKSVDLVLRGIVLEPEDTEAVTRHIIVKSVRVVEVTQRDEGEDIPPTAPPSRLAVRAWYNALPHAPPAA